jgi:hypothetical protein
MAAIKVPVLQVSSQSPKPVQTSLQFLQQAAISPIKIFEDGRGACGQRTILACGEFGAMSVILT